MSFGGFAGRGREGPQHNKVKKNFTKKKNVVKLPESTPKVVNQLVDNAIPTSIGAVVEGSDKQEEGSKWRITFKIKASTLKRLACIT